MRSELKKYVNSQFSVIKKTAVDYDESNSEVLIHSLRLSIKKLKAVMKMLNYADSDFKFKKNFKPFHDIYDSTGELRNQQVLTSLAKSNHIKKIPVTIDAEQVSAQLKISLPEMAKACEENKNAIENSIKHFVKNKFHKYFEKKKAELKLKLYPSLRLSNLHEARKIMKDLHFLSNFTNEKNKTETFHEETSALIGSWHDCKLLISKIRPNSNKADMIKLQTSNRRRIVEIRKKVKDFYFKKRP